MAAKREKEKKEREMERERERNRLLRTKATIVSGIKPSDVKKKNQ